MTIRVAACQIDVALGAVDANLDRIERAVADAAGRGARLVVLPEAAVTGYVFEICPVGGPLRVSEPRRNSDWFGSTGRGGSAESMP